MLNIIISFFVSNFGPMSSSLCINSIVFFGTHLNLRFPWRIFNNFTGIILELGFDIRGPRISFGFNEIAIQRIFPFLDIFGLTNWIDVVIFSLEIFWFETGSDVGININRFYFFHLQFPDNFSEVGYLIFEPLFLIFLSILFLFLFLQVKLNDRAFQRELRLKTKFAC